MRFAPAPQVEAVASRAQGHPAAPPSLSIVEIGILALLTVLLVFVVYLGVQVHKMTRVLYHIQPPPRISRYSSHF